MLWSGFAVDIGRSRCKEEKGRENVTGGSPNVNRRAPAENPWKRGPAEGHERKKVGSKALTVKKHRRGKVS